MTRIVYLCNSRLPTEKAHGYQIMKTCEAISRLGHEVYLLHAWRHQSEPRLEGVDPFDYYSIKPRFHIQDIRSLDPIESGRRLPTLAHSGLVVGYYFWWGLYAARKVAELRPDLVYTRDEGFAYWLARLNLPFAYESHVVPTRAWRIRLLRSFARRSAARAIFALTSPAASDLRRLGVPADKLGVLPDAVDLRVFGNRKSQGDARRQLGLPTDRPIIGYVGRFQIVGQEKGITELLRALARPELQSSGALLLCVGGPLDRVPSYMRVAQSLGVSESAVQFVDRVPSSEVPTWMAALDVATLPYPAIGDFSPSFARAVSPLKLFEYMATGLPIVATDIPALRDILRHGENALVTPGGDTAALALAMHRLIRDRALAESLGRRARQEAMQYTWERRAERAIASALGDIRPTERTT